MNRYQHRVWEYASTTLYLFKDIHGRRVWVSDCHQEAEAYNADRVLEIFAIDTVMRLLHKHFAQKSVAQMATISHVTLTVST